MRRAAKALIFDNQGKILVLYRSETHPTLAHDIDLPGGEVEEHETTILGLVREIFEETGLTVDIDDIHLQNSWMARSGQRQELYGVFIEETDDVVISWEHEAYDWISPDEMIDHSAVDDYIVRAQSWLRWQRKQTYSLR